MGKTSTDVQREIEELRRETSFIVEELQHRAREATDVRQQASKHPYVAGGLTVALLSGMVPILWWLIRRTSMLLGRRSQADTVVKRHKWASLWSSFSADPRRMMKSGPISSGFRILDQTGDNIMLRRVLWAMLSAGMVAVFGLVAKRLAASLWTATAKEQPPAHIP